MRFFVFLLISTEITPRLPLTFSGPLGSPPGGLPFETSSWFVGLPQFPIRWHTFHANFQFGTVRRFHVSTIRLNFMLHRIGATSNKRNQDKRVCFIKLKFPFAQWRRMKNQPAHWTRIHLNFPSLLGRSPSKKKISQNILNMFNWCGFTCFYGEIIILGYYVEAVLFQPWPSHENQPASVRRWRPSGAEHSEWQQLSIL